jgi:hypothetical protein
LIGIRGEHIADYHCLEWFGWGKGKWNGHDEGMAGAWNGGDPGETIEGKLSHGHGGKLHRLYKLDKSANPKGIDSAWRAHAHNHGKPYAIVEAKSDMEIAIGRARSKPGFSPSMVAKLGVTGIPKGEDMLEPYEDDAATSKTDKVTKASSKKRGSKGKASTTSASAAPKTQGRNDPEIFVQMSHEWIAKNLKAAVELTIARDISKRLPGDQKNYARHLLYTPQKSSCAQQHTDAYKNGTEDKENTHRDHKVEYVYDENRVKSFVNIKKTNLRKKYGEHIETLRREA